MKQQGISLAGRLDRNQAPACDDAVASSRNAGYGVQRLGIASIEPPGIGPCFQADSPPTAMAAISAVALDAAQVAGLPIEPIGYEYAQAPSSLEALRAAAGRTWQLAVRKAGGSRRLVLAGAGCCLGLVVLLLVLSRGGDNPLRPQAARAAQRGQPVTGLDIARRTDRPNAAKTDKGLTGVEFESTKAARTSLLFGDDSDGGRELVIQPRMAPSTEAAIASAVGSQLANRHATAGAETSASAPGTAQGPSDAGDERQYRTCPPGFVLHGVVRCPEGMLANISGQFVPVGGTVNNAIVVDIKDYSVEMEIEGRRFLLGINAPAPPPPKQTEQTEAEDESKAADKKPDDAQAAKTDEEKPKPANSSSSPSGKSESYSKRYTPAGSH
jgi:hypothetical protein